MHWQLCHVVSTTVNVLWHAGDMPTAQLPVLTEDWVTCCAPGAGHGLDADSADRLAAVLKVIAEPTRLRLLSLVAAQQDSEECICNLTDRVGVSQPTVSHHMKVMVEAGLLEREQRGKWAYYRLVPGALDALARLVTTVAQPA
jgi:ArsR family transcriptional regulator, arsenate/arsenite/antimonite-responsive transcriptional repressor